MKIFISLLIDEGGWILLIYHYFFIDGIRFRRDELDRSEQIGF